MDDDSAQGADRDWPRLLAVYEPHHVFVVMGEPSASAALVGTLADEAPDETNLEALSISLVEAFLGVRGADGYPLFEQALRSSSNLRKAWSFAWSSVPDEWQKRFDALIRPGEVLGGA